MTSEETEKALGEISDIQDDDPTDQGPHFLLSRRWRLCLLLFFVLMLLYMHRVNLSLAVVCMVDTSAGGKSHHSGKLNVTSVNTTLTSHDVFMQLREMNATQGTVETFDALDDCGNGKIDGQKSRKIDVYDIHWSKAEVSVLLSSYFYGSFFTQIPAGRMADYFGGKHIITVMMAVSGACALLTPTCAKYSITWMYVIRIVIGLAGGAVIPVCVAMLGVWAPPQERATMLACSFAGVSLGTVVTYLTSGVLCEHGFAGGWPSIFYIHGAVTFVFVIAWLFEAANNPGQHPRIHYRELAFLQRSIPHSSSKRSIKTPWVAMVTSKPLWASFATHFAYNWSFFAILINIPLFMKEVLVFEIEQNGLYSSLPYIFLLTFTLISSKVSSLMIKRSILPHLATRRLFTAVSLIGSSTCLIIAGHVDCRVRHLAVVLLCMACVFQGFMYGGLFANHVEFAGPYAGTVFGITNAGGVISALLSSLTAGLLTPNGLRTEWQTVFYVAAAVNVCGTLMFSMCSSVRLETWAWNQSISVQCKPNKSQGETGV